MTEATWVGTTVYLVVAFFACEAAYRIEKLFTCSFLTSSNMTPKHFPLITLLLVELGRLKDAYGSSLLWLAKWRIPIYLWAISAYAHLQRCNSGWTYLMIIDQRLPITSKHLFLLKQFLSTNWSVPNLAVSGDSTWHVIQAQDPLALRATKYDRHHQTSSIDNFISLINILLSFTRHSLFEIPSSWLETLSTNLRRNAIP